MSLQKPNTFCITNGRIVLPDRVEDNGTVLVRDGKIASVHCSLPENVAAVDARGGYILPGFIDIHLHGGGGADFMDGTEEAVRTVARAHCAHGTTAMVPTTMTCPDELLERFIGLYLRVKREGTGSADFLGIHLEGPYFAAASKGAQPIGEERLPDREYMERILSLAQGEIIRWDAAPELAHMELFAKTLREHGVMAAIAHTSAVAEQAEKAFSWGFTHMTHFYNAMTTFRKINRRVYAGVIEAAYLNDAVTVELIGDGRHIPKESMQLAYRIKGPERIALITDAMRATGTNVKKSVLGSLSSGVPVVIFDGVAQLEDYSSYAGSIATLDHALRVAHLEYGIPLADTVRMLSLTPAILCGAQERKGSLKEGKDADIVVMTPDFTVEKVYVRGELFKTL